MVKDHTQANNELKPIADLNKIPWPSRLEGESEATYNRLAKLSGAKFDAEYVEVMVKDHDKTMSAFEEASTKVKDPSLRTFIDKTLPVTASAPRTYLRPLQAGSLERQHVTPNSGFAIAAASTRMIWSFSRKSRD